MLRQLTTSNLTTHLIIRLSNPKNHFNRKPAREKESIETPYVKEETRTPANQHQQEDAVHLPTELLAPEHALETHLETMPTHTDKQRPDLQNPDKTLIRTNVPGAPKRAPIITI